MSTSTKVGGVRKCPNCGATVDALAMQCSECGHMFNGAEAADVLTQFEEKVNAANMFSRAGVIKRFPVPNTQEALFSLISYLEPLCEDGSSMNPMLTSAYQSKYSECMTRAKIAFPNHPTVLVYKELEKKRKRKRTIITVSAALFLLLVVGGSGFFAFRHLDGKETETATATETESATETANLTEENTEMANAVSAASPTELPAGWDTMYVMGGKYMYCNAKFPCSEGTFSVDLYKDGISISLTSINANTDS